MKKIVEILENLQDAKMVISSLGSLDTASVDKYWMSAGLQTPTKGDAGAMADVYRLLLMAFGPESSIPSMQRQAPRLRTCSDYNDSYRRYWGQERYDPVGVFTISSAYQSIPWDFFPAIFRRLGTVKVRIPDSAVATHFSEGRLGWLREVRQIELLGLYSSVSLDEIPSDIGTLSDLESLTVSWTDIEELPDSIFDLSNLTSLDLSHNKIGAIQDEFTRLERLSFLDISDNGLETIPESVTTNKSISDCRLYGNPLKDINDGLAFNTYRINRTEDGTPVLYPGDTLVINDTWLDIPPERIGAIIEKHGIEKLRVESAEMLERILEPSAAGCFKAIKFLDLHWREWVELEYMGTESHYVESSNDANDEARLSELPEGISNLEFLEELDLSGNEIEELPDELFNLERLRKLNLSENQLSDLPDLFDSLENLEHLDFASNSISLLPESLFRLSNLKSLNAGNYSMHSLNEDIGLLENLEELVLTGASISELPKSVGDLKKLKTLNLDRVKIGCIPDEICELSELSCLSMESAGVTSIPEAIANLTKLTELNLSDNRIESVPAAIGGLAALQKLYLEDNAVVEIDEAIGECVELVDLNLASNSSLGGLPDSVGKLTKLERLSLSACDRLTGLPDVFDKLTRLKDLDLQGVKADPFPRSLYQCTSIRFLSLYGTPLKRLDDGIVKLKNLEQLDLRMSGVTTLPSRIGMLKKLKKLETSQLSEALPDSFFELEGLEELDMNIVGVENPFQKSMQGLKSLRMLNVSAKGAKCPPFGLKDIKGLTSITFRYSDLDSIPDEWYGLEGLVTLDLRNNKIEELSIEKMRLFTLKLIVLSGNPVAESASLKKQLRWCLPGTTIN